MSPEDGEDVKTVKVRFGGRCSALFLQKKIQNLARDGAIAWMGYYFGEKVGWRGTGVVNGSLYHGQLGLSLAFPPYQFPVHSYELYAI
jgi:hypothetical protein